MKSVGFIFFIFLFVVLKSGYDVNAAIPKCMSVILPDLEECSRHGLDKLAIPSCVNNSVCRRPYNVSTIQMEPLSDTFMTFILQKVLATCCGSCDMLKLRRVQNFNDSRKISLESIASSEFVFPIIGHGNPATIYNYHYLPLLGAPDLSLFTKTLQGEQILFRLLDACFNLWPIVVIALILCIITGFPIWLVEMNYNENEFPKPFLSGLFEGFWWSFITMTTVGYGDKTPKVFVSKLFAVVWILIGITVSATLTASITTEITGVTTPQTPTVSGKRIGVVKGRMHEASAVISQGGHVVVTKSAAIESAMEELLDQVRHKSIDGYILDKYAYAHAYEIYKGIWDTPNHNRREVAEYFLHSLFKTHLDNNNEGEALSYGILIRDKDMFDYIKQFVQDNKHMLVTCRELQLHLHFYGRALKSYNIFQPKGVVFQIVMIILGAVVGLIICLGVVYEYTRFVRRKGKAVPVAHAE